MAVLCSIATSLMDPYHASAIISPTSQSLWYVFTINFVHYLAFIIIEYSSKT